MNLTGRVWQQTDSSLAGDGNFRHWRRLSIACTSQIRRGITRAREAG